MNINKHLVDFFIRLLDSVNSTQTLSADDLKFANADIFNNVIDSLWTESGLMYIAIGLSLIYFLMEMNRKLALEGRDLNLKSIMVPFLKLGISLTIIFNATGFISAILNLNNYLVDVMNSISLDTGALSTDAIRDAFNSQVQSINFILKLVLFIPLVLSFLAALAAKVVWWYKVIGYKIEMIFRVGVTPIAMADVYSGQQSNSIKWLKQLLALGLYGASMILIPKIAMTLGISMLSTGIDASGDICSGDIWDLVAAGASLIVIPFAALGTLTATKQACREVLGV